MSKNLYRKKIIYDDGLLLHIINTKGRTYFNFSNKENIFATLNKMGFSIYYDKFGDIKEIEFFSKDIEDVIEKINKGYLKYQDGLEEQIKLELIEMKNTLKRENEDIFILYSL